MPNALEFLPAFVLQFDGAEAGQRFVEAWKRTRIIVDTGGGHGNGGAPAPRAFQITSPPNFALPSASKTAKQSRSKFITT